MTIRLALKLLALVMLGMALSSCVVVIQPTEIGVVQDMISGELETPLLAGTHILPVSKTVTIYPITQQEYTFAAGRDGTGDAIEALTSDGQAIVIDVTVLFSIDPDQVNLVHVTWSNTYAENFIRPKTRSVVRDVTALYTAESLYAVSRLDWQDAIHGELEPQFTEAGFILHDVLIRSVVFPEAFTATLEAQLIATMTAVPTP